MLGNLFASRSHLPYSLGRQLPLDFDDFHAIFNITYPIMAPLKYAKGNYSIPFEQTPRRTDTDVA